MKLRRHLKSTAILSTLCVGMLFPMAAQAEPEYEMQDVTAYLFDGEHPTEMTLAFKSDLPTIPYIKVTDYLNAVYKADDFAATKQADGTYLVGSATSEYTMTVDPNDEVVSFEKYYDFVSQSPNVASDMNVTFAEMIERGYDGGAKPASFDLGAYDIDIMEINDEAYIPVPTMNDLFMRLYNAAQYLDGELYFLHSSDTLTGACYYDRGKLFERMERPASEAQFNYNELCFMMDTSYGAPSRCKLAEKILADGFDKTLDSSDRLKKAKTYLKSENLLDYNIGLIYIGIDLFDGGHTAPGQDINTAIAYYPDSKLVTALKELLTDPDRVEDKDIFLEYVAQAGARDTVIAEISQDRATTIPAQYATVKEWEDCGAGLYVAGDTAIFTFNSFTLPIVDAFKWSVDKAAELGMKNFVVDLSTNNGGVTQVGCYMLALMANKKLQTNEFTLYNYYRASDERGYEKAVLDLNLDGNIDDADKAVSYDLNFAFLESRCSYSAGNLTPVLAKEMGIAVLGENSGGGGCALNIDFTASGYFMNVSGMTKLSATDPDIDVDLGAKPDFVLAYDKMFDSEILSSKIHEFYKDYKNEWVDGKWYDKNGKQSYKYKADWKKVGKNWTFVDESGWYAKNQWQKIDGKWYFFDKKGNMESSCYRQGCYLTKSGAWDGKAKAKGWKQDKKGWWYGLTGSSYLKNSWQKIDGNWYYFKANGYVAQSEFVQGWWVNKNGVQSDPVKYSWHKAGSKWWYGVKDGWYAKSATYTIDSISYKFDKNGYYTEK